ncbi:hypothetical protein BP6252_13723 [Coleophoma cylindrospora]|uniref:Transcription factor domain-containing protein n=1 Tax=Coleophoma cylindrospora TaxID=1849047 RepID=A0A3D8Q763_9HELO|nr:hypothetical protein BP6252_13723 [Coleophoma cylindrospora]
MQRRYIRALEVRVAELEALDPQQRQDHDRPASSAADDAIQVENSPRPIERNDPLSGDIHADSSFRPEQDGDRRSKLTASCSGTFEEQSPPVSGNGSIVNSSIVSTLQAPSIRSSILGDGDDEADLDYLLFTAAMSPADMDASPKSHISLQGRASARVDNIPSPKMFTSNIEDILVETYFQKAQIQYPFLHYPDFISWQSSWRLYTVESAKNTQSSQILWKGFFVNLVGARPAAELFESYFVLVL